MAVRKRVNTTKLEIVQIACQMVLENGYHKTTIKQIADALQISPGHVMFYFPSKEHLLAELVGLLCDFQWRAMQRVVEEGNTSVIAVCLELMAMASMCEDDPIARDFYIASYTNPIPLDMIRKNDVDRAKLVFGAYCGDWEDSQFQEAEVLVSGIEYATLMTTPASAPLRTRIAGALNAIMQIYRVPETIRQQKIERILAMDYHGIGRRILAEFKAYVARKNEQAIEELF